MCLAVSLMLSVQTGKSGVMEGGRREGGGRRDGGREREGGREGSKFLQRESVQKVM